MPKAGSSRPSESTSMVAHCLAVSTGSRSPRLATFIPNLMRRVPPARAAMTLMHSSPPSAPMMRSDCQMESTPPRVAEIHPAPEAARVVEVEVGDADAGADGHRVLLVMVGEGVMIPKIRRAVQPLGRRESTLPAAGAGQFRSHGHRLPLLLSPGVRLWTPPPSKRLRQPFRVLVPRQVVRFAQRVFEVPRGGNRRLRPSFMGTWR